MKVYTSKDSTLNFEKALELPYPRHIEFLSRVYPMDYFVSQVPSLKTLKQSQGSTPAYHSEHFYRRWTFNPNDSKKIVYLDIISSQFLTMYSTSAFCLYFNDQQEIELIAAKTNLCGDFKYVLLQHFEGMINEAIPGHF